MTQAKNGLILMEDHEKQIEAAIDKIESLKKEKRLNHIKWTLLFVSIIVWVTFAWQYNKTYEVIFNQEKALISKTSQTLIKLGKTRQASAKTPMAEDEPLSIIIGIKGSLADKNNNPCNLMYVKQKGASKGFKGFAMFNSVEDGYQACINQVKIDQSRGLTLRKFITKYAPPHENDTWKYITTLASNLGISNNTNISSIDSELLTKQLALFESQTIIK
jgi:hypothetical protein